MKGFIFCFGIEKFTMKRLYNFLSTALVLLLGSGSGLMAQQPVHCGTDLLLQEEMSTPEGRQNIEQFNTQIRNWVQNNAGRTSSATYVIPTVIHVIQESATDYPSETCILNQIDILNEDFGAYNADTALVPQEFKSIIGNTDLEFCLASVDPQGNPTNGIIRIVDPTNANHSMSNSSQLKALSQWDPTKYLNIWIPKNISGGILGYATFPTGLAGNPANDGVVLNGEYVGRNGCGAAPFDLGRTATHEVGHWLGLYHTFQDGCSGTSAADCASSGDEVCDTPPTASSNFGCPPQQNTCTETPVDMNDNTHNYMDYGDDNCIIMFTIGQADRMQAVLNTTRANLWSQANLADANCGCSAATPCSPNANFTADNTIVCANQIVNFTDLSSGPATSWAWTFQGGSPGTSTLENPSVIFSSPGTYDVTLTSTNALGTSTVTQTTYITVASPSQPPVMEDFEATTMPVDWQVFNPDNTTTWQLYTGTGSSGSQCVWMDNWDYTSNGTEDALISTIIDLANYGTGDLSFDYCYQRASFTFDTMSVWLSSDCGTTWNKEWEKFGGTDLANVGGVGISTPYTPTGASDFTTESIDLVNYLGSDQVKVKFVNLAGSGNSLYLDNININAIVGRPDPGNGPLWNMNIVPNPFQESFTVQYSLPSKVDIHFSLVDLNGRVIYATDLRNQAPGQHSFDLPAEIVEGLGAGFYFLRGDSEIGNISRKVVRMK